MKGALNYEKDMETIVYGLFSSCDCRYCFTDYTRSCRKQDVVYTESWCPKYENLKTVKHWFNEWNTRGKVIIWDIKQFFHKENQTVVEWYFKNEMNTGSVEEFDGISLIEWTEDNKIKSLKEYGCNLNNYNPYQHSDNPQFRDEKTNWF